MCIYRCSTVDSTVLVLHHFGRTYVCFLWYSVTGVRININESCDREKWKRWKLRLGFKVFVSKFLSLRDVSIVAEKWRDVNWKCLLDFIGSIIWLVALNFLFWTHPTVFVAIVFVRILFFVLDSRMTSSSRDARTVRGQELLSTVLSWESSEQMWLCSGCYEPRHCWRSL